MGLLSYSSAVFRPEDSLRHRGRTANTADPSLRANSTLLMIDDQLVAPESETPKSPGDIESEPFHDVYAYDTCSSISESGQLTPLGSAMTSNDGSDDDGSEDESDDEDFGSKVEAPCCCRHHSGCCWRHNSTRRRNPHHHMIKQQSHGQRLHTWLKKIWNKCETKNIESGPKTQSSSCTIAPVHTPLLYHLAHENLACIRRSLDSQTKIAFIPELSCEESATSIYGTRYYWSNEIYFNNGTFLQKQKADCYISREDKNATAESFTGCPHHRLRISKPVFTKRDDLKCKHG